MKKFLVLLLIFCFSMPAMCKHISYRTDGTIISIGDMRVSYSDGRISDIGDLHVFYRTDGTIISIGDMRVSYSDGRISDIGD